MSDAFIIERCVRHLGMTMPDAEQVAEQLYTYALPDWSEWSWAEIDQCLRDVRHCIHHPEQNPFGLDKEVA